MDMGSLGDEKAGDAISYVWGGGPWNCLVDMGSLGDEKVENRYFMGRWRMSQTDSPRKIEIRMYDPHMGQVYVRLRWYQHLWRVSNLRAI